MQTRCIEWAKARNRSGYGVFRRKGRNFLAHRAALFAYMGIQKSNLSVLHKCDNPGCVNPEHLYLGTQAQNVRDMCERGRARGGALTPLRGEAAPWSKLTAADVRAIRDWKGTQQEIAVRLGVAQQTISDIQRGRRWRGLE